MSSLFIQRGSETLPLVKDLHQANRFLERFLGLMGRSNYPMDAGLLFPNCSSVHMYFMRMPIDIVFLKTLDEIRFEVLSVHEAIQPWRPLPLSNFRADAVLEMAAGNVVRNEVKEGDHLCIA